MKRMFITGLFLHLLYENVLEKPFEKFREICSQEVDPYVRQRVLHCTVYKTFVGCFDASQNRIGSCDKEFSTTKLILNPIKMKTLKTDR